MDKGWLTKETYASTEVHVGLRYRIISPKEMRPIPADQRVQAYHLEVDALNAEHFKTKLQKFFWTAHGTDNPMQICMRLVLPMQLLWDPKMIDKAVWLRTRQALFAKKIQKTDLVGTAGPGFSS